MHHYTKKILGLLLMASFLGGCYYRNEDDLYPCTASNITYTNTIKSIVDSRCVSCHNGSGTTLPGLYDFRDYNVLKRVALTDSVYKAVTGQFPGKPRMPYGGPYLSDCEISKIKTWVSNGAPH
jgi:mono/diheme cytochrome c family protein